MLEIVFRKYKQNYGPYATKEMTGLHFSAMILLRNARMPFYLDTCFFVFKSCVIKLNNSRSCLQYLIIRQFDYLKKKPKVHDIYFYIFP